MTFRQNITRIKGLSDRRRLPLLGKIRLGLKVKTDKGTEYPRETPYFVVPDEVAEIYGGKPTEIDIMLPLDDIDAVFPCAYVYYGSSKGLKCKGDGELAYTVNSDTNEMGQIQCPCDLLEQGKCKQVGRFLFMIPKVSVGGVYQISTSSFNSIVDIQSGLDYASALLGRFALIPLKLKRVKTETHHDDKKQTHYTLQVVFDGDLAAVNALRQDTTRILEHPRYQLPAPVEENPEFDPPDMEISDEEDELPFPDFKDILARIDKLKSQIVDIDGSDETYWEALKLYGVEQAADFKTRDAMIDLGKDLKSYIDKKGGQGDR